MIGKEVLEFACPKCGAKVSAKRSQLKTTNAVCTKCSAVIDGKAIINGLERGERELAELDREFRQLGN